MDNAFGLRCHILLWTLTLCLAGTVTSDDGSVSRELSSTMSWEQIFRAIEAYPPSFEHGEQRFHRALRDAPDMRTLVADLRKKGYPPGVQRTYMVARAMSDLEFVVAGSLCPDVVRECKMKPVDTIEEGLAYAQRKLGRELDVVIVPHALLTLPVVMN